MTDEDARRLTVYVSPSCPHCRATLAYLDARGASFEVRDVTADREALTHLVWITGRATVPAIVAGGDVLIGFDTTRLDEMIEALGRPALDPPHEDETE